MWHGYTKFKKEAVGALKMSDQFELFCEYFHCCGIKKMKLGETETETMAKLWKEDQTQGKQRPRLPKDHLIITCPVKHCPAKLQIPRYDYRKTVA